MNKRLQWASCFLLGVCALSFLPELPLLSWWLLLLLLAGLLLCRWPICRLSAMVLLGFSWAGLQAVDQLGTRLPAAYEGVDVLLAGRVVSLPLERQRSTRFVFEVDEVLDAGGQQPLPIQRIRLNWYHPPQAVQPGERWRLRVRLKRPHGFSNPHGFDYESWLFQWGIDATGYVRSDAGNLRLEWSSGFQINTWRASIGQRMDALIPVAQHRALIKALAIGDRSEMSEAQWQVLRRTGTSHLMAISGLHIGLISGFVFALVRWGLVIAGVKRVSPQRSAVVLAMLAAFGYAALSGFGIPAQRALVMVVVVLGAVYSQRHFKSSTVFATALFGVLLIDPLAVMSAGFWLSFTAVAVLLWGMSGFLGSMRTLKSLGLAQWLIGLGLAPLVVLFFQQWPLISPLSNLFAVPWVSCIVVPLVLLGSVLAYLHEGLAAFCLMGADLALTMLWWLLEPMSRWSASQWQPPSIGTLAVVLAGTGSALLLAPRGTPGRGLSVLLFLPMFFPLYETPEAGDFRLTLLDVGQGLSAVVETQHHVLVFDTGARWSERFDMAKSVVIPFLNASGQRRIDRLVVSHGDNDHAGGVASLRARLNVKRILTSVPQQIEGTEVVTCNAGQRWQWDGVQFEMLHPSPGSLFTGNNASCVLRIESVWGSALLTGDIEKSAERVLLREQPAKLDVDLLVAPHHGSATSSTRSFVEVVSPQQVWFPVGYRNRFRFPRPDVVDRYRQQGSQVFDTAQHGALTRVFSSAMDRTVRSHRLQSLRYWHWRPGPTPASS